jgi:hypothetical protein
MNISHDTVGESGNVHEIVLKREDTPRVIRPDQRPGSTPAFVRVPDRQYKDIASARENFDQAAGISLKNRLPSFFG